MPWFGQERCSKVLFFISFMSMVTIPALYSLFLEHGRVTTDSRQAGNGVIFFALRGERFNGNDFAREALAAGSPCVVADDPSLKGESGIFLVEDVLTVLQQLAAYHRNQLAIPILAVTGTNGKTTTKELIHAVLSKKFPVTATMGNLNNHIGVPLTLLSMDASTRIGIVEMGANHPGEIAFLCQIASPTHGLITNIGKAHLEGFGGFEGVIQTKNELYRALNAPGRTIFVNGSNLLLTGLLEGTRADLVKYGAHPDSCCKLEEKASWPFLQASWGDIPITTSLAGSYNLENLEAASAVGLHFGLTREMIVESISAYQPRNNRSQWIDTGKNRVLCDFYNANPSSMALSLSHFFRYEVPQGMKKMVLLGDMFELGDASEAEHLTILSLLENHPGVEAWCAGAHFLKASLHCPGVVNSFPDTDSMAEAVRSANLRGNVLLVKGSRGMRMEQLLPLL